MPTKRATKKVAKKLAKKVAKRKVSATKKPTKRATKKPAKRRIGLGVFNTLLNSGLLPELHYRGFDQNFKKHSFTGPGTDLVARLDKDGYPMPDSMPINDVDWTAWEHDNAYNNSKDLPTRRIADDTMIRQLTEIGNDKKRNWRIRADAKIVNGFMRSKRFLGLGIIRRRKRISA